MLLLFNVNYVTDNGKCVQIKLMCNMYKIGIVSLKVQNINWLKRHLKMHFLPHNSLFQKFSSCRKLLLFGVYFPQQEMIEILTKE